MSEQQTLAEVERERDRWKQSSENAQERLNYIIEGRDELCAWLSLAESEIKRLEAALEGILRPLDQNYIPESDLVTGPNSATEPGFVCEIKGGKFVCYCDSDTVADAVEAAMLEGVFIETTVSKPERVPYPPPEDDPGEASPGDHSQVMTLSERLT